ncbi:MAG: DNA polymerase III subunit [Chloroflexi bacterium]|nr:DNA polymerase III subunit [Chloroflexota bacterium]
MKATSPPAWPVIGHEWAVQFLQRTIEQGRTRHAYLFVGPADIGKRQVALAFAMALNCKEGGAAPCQRCRNCQLIRQQSSADLFFSQTSGSSNTLPIEEIRRASAFLALQPYEMRYRIAILNDFERTAPLAQDALLKTLEEPPPYALLFLLAADESQISPTILSRCQKLRLRQVDPAVLAEQLTAQYEAAREQAQLLAQVSGGRPGWAIRALQDEALMATRNQAIALLNSCMSQSRAERFRSAERLAKDKKTFEETLSWWQSYWRDVLLLAVDPSHAATNCDQHQQLATLARELKRKEIVRALQATRKLSERLALNLNLRLAIEVLLLAYPRLPRYHMISH